MRVDCVSGRNWDSTQRRKARQGSAKKHYKQDFPVLLNMTALLCNVFAGFFRPEGAVTYQAQGRATWRQPRSVALGADDL